jgi:hypothetical protein
MIRQRLADVNSEIKKEARSARSLEPLSSLLPSLGLGDQPGKWKPQTSGNRLGRIQVRAALASLKKPDIGLMESGHGGQSRAAQALSLSVSLHNRRKSVR